MKYAALILFVISSFSSHGAQLISHERIQEQKSCFSGVFGDYASWRNAMEKKYRRNYASEEKVDQVLTHFDGRFGKEKFDRYKRTLSCSTFKYEVDGHLVNGYVMKPKTAKDNLPVLIYNRGGNGNFGGVVFGAMMHNLFPIAHEGFIIIGSQYRGTFSRHPTAADEFGGSDVDDVTTLFDFIPNIEDADETRIGMFGASRGGMQTFLALKETSKVRAVAVIAGVSDLLKELDFRPDMEKVYAKRIPNYQRNKTTELARRSVLNWVDKLSPQVPILLLHGEADKRVSVSNSVTLAKALESHHMPHKLILYPDDNHGLTKNKGKALHEIVSWFRQYL